MKYGKSIIPGEIGKEYFILLKGEVEFRVPQTVDLIINQIYGIDFLIQECAYFIVDSAFEEAMV